MSKRFKVMVISAIIALAFTLPLAAQTNTISDPTTVGTLQGVTDPTSNQRSATATLYKTDVDNYLNVNNWSGVKFDKWFGFLHGSTPYLDGYHFRANLGYATNVGGIYLATRYWGNIFQDTGGDERVTLTPTYDEDTQTLISLTETTAYPNKWRNSTNHIDVLIGVAGQGIRVGFYESMAFKAADGSNARYFTKTDLQDGSIQYRGEVDEYSQFGGHLRPSLQWGTQLSVSNLTIKPRAGAAFNIYQDTLVDNYANYDTVNGKLVGTKTLTRAQGYDRGYMQPVFAAGADIGLPKKDTLATTVSIDYLMNLNIYNNDYSASGFEGTAKGPVGWGGGSNNTTTTTTSIYSKTTETRASLTFNDSSRFYHRIAPKVTLDKAVADGLKLGLVVQAPVTITTTSSDQYSETKTYTETTVFNPINSAEGRTTRDTTAHTPQGLTETTALSVSPQLRIGASYVLIPSRFTVNAGVNLDPTVYSYTKTTQSRNGDGTRTTITEKNGDGVVTSKSDTTSLLGGGGTYTDSSTINNSWSAFNGSVGGGFLLNFNENIALDFWANGGSFSGYSSNWNIDASSINVMLTFKF